MKVSTLSAALLALASVGAVQAQDIITTKNKFCLTEITSCSIPLQSY